jgi:phage tail sheath protein FI
MVALLSLPPHYGRKETLLHVGKLTAGGTERLSGGPNAGIDIGLAPLPPLGLEEHRVLSYGVLSHPWLTMRLPDRGVTREQVTLSLPPDGAVAGSMAGLAIERGAWLAPANRPLQRVLALTPRFDLEDWRKTTPARVNLILQSPQGFVLFSELTLSRDASLAPIHIRRLLILLRRLALREGDRFVFAPNDTNLQHLVRHRFEAVLANLYSRGAFVGVDPTSAFRVVTDETVNPVSSIERGRFIVELQIAPAHALSFITVRLVADERGRLTVEEV